MLSQSEKPVTPDGVAMTTKNPFDALCISLRDYLDSAKYSDLIIRCEGREFKVHKIVLCGQSNYFSNACDGVWKEATDGVIELKDDDVQVVEAMLHFLYTFDYDASGNDQRRVSPMLFNVRVYTIADKYDILALKVRAKEKFQKAVNSCWDMDDFANVIAEIYRSTPPTDRGLRDLVVDVANEHIESLLKKDNFLYILEETAGFAADLVRLMVLKPFTATTTVSTTTVRCPNCSKVWQTVLSPEANYYYCIHCGVARYWDDCVRK